MARIHEPTDEFKLMTRYDGIRNYIDSLGLGLFTPSNFLENPFYRPKTNPTTIWGQLCGALGLRQTK
jgi:hypothetical protein